VHAEHRNRRNRTERPLHEQGDEGHVLDNAASHCRTFGSGYPCTQNIASLYKSWCAKQATPRSVFAFQRSRKAVDFARWYERLNGRGVQRSRW
jgi:hypothetical protein